MKTVREVMSRQLITVHPSSTIKTAIILLKGHEIGALPVVNGEALLGLLECQDVLGRDPDEPVTEVMKRDFVSVEPDLPVHKAADTMARAGVTRALVEEEGLLVGIVTHTDVLPVLGRSYDPLTGLHWSDALRDWAYDELSKGEEISILFFDLDLFRIFNKKYGHITGDAVLKAVSAVFSEVTNEETDLLCRMGGDEFVIGTTRSREATVALGTDAQQRISRIRVEGVEEDIGVNFGVSGGRRSKEREAVHYAATIDDLLNRASLECTRMKREKRGRLAEEEARAPAAAREADAAASKPRIRIEQLTYSASESEMRVDVRLSCGGQTHEGSASGHSALSSAPRLAAEACVRAIASTLPSDVRVALDDLTELHLTNSLVAVISTVALATPRETTRYYGLAVVRRGDAHRSAAASVLSALNRPIEKLQ